jgi:hypothetical protein
MWPKFTLRPDIPVLRIVGPVTEFPVTEFPRVAAGGGPRPEEGGVEGAGRRTTSGRCRDDPERHTVRPPPHDDKPAIRAGPRPSIMRRNYPVPWYPHVRDCWRCHQTREIFGCHQSISENERLGSKHIERRPLTDATQPQAVSCRRRSHIYTILRCFYQ